MAKNALPQQQDPVLTKLQAARTRLILEKPFLGTLVLHLPLIEADPQWCKTTAISPKSLFYNHEYIEGLNIEETQFVLAHEALHCALVHFNRREQRHKMRWDVACDYAINPILLAEKLIAPRGILYEKSFEGMTAEEIYPYVAEHPEEGPMDQHLDDDQGKGDAPLPHPQQAEGNAPTKGQGGGAKPKALNTDEKDRLKTQWQQRCASAAQMALQSGKLSAGLTRLLDHLLQAQLPWRMLLARFISQTARDDYSYTRPSSRRGDPAIFPSLRSAQINLVVIVDSSGSIQTEELREFFAEINAIKGFVRARVLLHSCDSALAAAGPWIYEPWEDFVSVDAITGGGGTDFRPAFTWAQQLSPTPDLLVYFSDANGPFPNAAPDFPVLWLIKGKTPVPWGQRVQLN